MQSPAWLSLAIVRYREGPKSCLSPGAFGPCEIHSATQPEPTRFPSHLSLMPLRRGAVDDIRDVFLRSLPNGSSHGHTCHSGNRKLLRNCLLARMHPVIAQDRGHP